MPRDPRISNEILLTAGLQLMQQRGTPLRRRENTGRAMLYEMPDGKTVRVRTCNDHILVVIADDTSENARLNIEGTELLLIVMPEVERTHGRVIAYLVPTKVAVVAARQTHRAWLSTKPNTKGDNRTWNLWFDSTGPAKANDFASKWRQYRLEGEVDTRELSVSSSANGHSLVEAPNGTLKSEVEAAKRRIAAAAGVSPEAVRITVDFGV